MNDIEIDATKMISKDVVDILNQYPMCDLVIEKESLLILDHRGFIIKKIKFNK